MSLMCRVYNVTRGGYYAWKSRGLSERKRLDLELLTTIKEIFKKSRETYGSPRIYQELRKRGIAIGEKRVARIMQEHGIKARSVRVYRSNPSLKKFFVRIPNNSLEQKADAPNQIMGWRYYLFKS